MANRFVPALLIVLLIVIHAQLWQGRGSRGNLGLLYERLNLQTAKNEQAQIVNDRLSAEVRDLQEGLEMVEEKARKELGMVKPQEIFVQIAR